MNSAQTLNIVELLQENGYRMTEDNAVISLKKSNSGSIVSVFIFGTIGLILLTFGLYFGLHFTTIISGLFFIGVPLIYDRWRYPNTIEIDRENNSIILKSGLINTRKFKLSDISSLEVDEAVVSSDVSPFKDGYQDFIYTFNLHVGKSKEKLLNLVFREERTLNIGQITDYLSEKLALQMK